MTTPPAPTTDPPAPPAPTPPPAPPSPPTPPPADDEAAKLRAALDDERKQRKAAEAKLDRLSREGMTEQERLIAEAKAAGKAEAAAEHARDLAAARFLAVAAGRLAAPDKALARLDLDKLVKDSKPDEAAIAAAVDDLAAIPAPPGHVPPGPRTTAPPGSGDFFRDTLNAVR